MIKITERAKQLVQLILNAKVDFPGGLLRVMDSGQGTLGLGIDIEMPGDEIVKYEGSAILVIERKFAANLKKITLDVEESIKGPENVRFAPYSYLVT